MELNRVCISLLWCDLSPHCQYFSRRKYKPSVWHLGSSLVHIFGGGIVGRLPRKPLRPLTVRLVHLFSFWSMSGLKCDAVICWLGGCQFGSVFVWWTDHDFWLLVGYGALTNSGLFINGASGCAGTIFFFFSFFCNVGTFCLNCCCPKTCSPLPESSAWMFQWRLSGDDSLTRDL